MLCVYLLWDKWLPLLPNAVCVRISRCVCACVCKNTSTATDTSASCPHTSCSRLGVAWRRRHHGHRVSKDSGPGVSNSAHRRFIPRDLRSAVSSRLACACARGRCRTSTFASRVRNPHSQLASASCITTAAHRTPALAPPIALPPPHTCMPSHACISPTAQLKGGVVAKEGRSTVMGVLRTKGLWRAALLWRCASGSVRCYGTLLGCHHTTHTHIDR